ncbi:MAG: type II toxin-antitoxin system RelE/ParE family toxin [bacterium]|nr:type II toxin-antitoxin system RelE/ParE family toxin [bacterium]
MDRRDLKPVEWVGSSKEDLRGFPAEVQDHVGFALYQAQVGLKHRDAKPLKGLGSGVLEVVSRHDGGTYRAVYTVRFNAAVYVLHAFQKKAKRGISTPKQEMETVRRRLRAAEQHYDDIYGRRGEQ